MVNEKKYSLLYVEDDIQVREMVVLYLSDFFTDIYEAGNGLEALLLYQSKNPDIIITDIQMPKMNGLSLARKIREIDKTIPIMIITAYTSTKYLLEAVELSLIKYLLKPVDEESLYESLTKCFESLEYFSYNNIAQLTSNHHYDTFNHTLTYKNEIIPLTSSQFKFLDLLIKHKNRALSYEEIENYIWYDKGMSGSAIRSLVYDLRKIIDKDLIQNISKIGYRIKLYHEK